jgi:hypothetical protein
MYGRRAFGETIDVSDSGLLAHLPHLDASVGNHVELTVEAAGSTIPALGRVVRAHGDDNYAFSFVEIRQTARERLARLVAERQDELAA